jgi:hypothetical protein
MRASFLIYKGFYDPIKHLEDDQLGKLFRALFEYQINDIEPENSDPIYMAFQFFKNQFVLDQVKYSEKCDRNSQNAKKRWNANECDRMQTNAINADKDKEKEKEKDLKDQSEIEFNIFWNLYGKKIDRVKCLKAYKKIHSSKRAFVYERARIYVSLTPEVKYRKNPLTWLNGECWNDEMIERPNTNGKYVPTL